MKTSKLFATISVVALSFWAGQVNAQEVQPGVFKVEQGASQKIDRFGVCRIVSNDGADSIMVPTQSADEWFNGVNSFLLSLSYMDHVRVAACGEWWEGRSILHAEFSSAHPSVITFRDGETRTVVNGAVTLQAAQWYNAATGQCGPAKSYIGTGPIWRYGPFIGNVPMLFRYIQVCDSDGIASAPFIDVPTETAVGSGTFVDMSDPVASFDKR